MSQRLLATLGFATLTSVAAAQTPAATDVSAVSEPVEVTVAPAAVTAYLGRASVTRPYSRTLAPGLYALRFVDLPETVYAESIQARVDGPAQVLGVEYEERAVREISASRVADLDAMIATAELALMTAHDERGLLAAQERFLDAVTTRMGNGGDSGRGDDALDLDALREQLDFVTAELARLFEDRRVVAGREKTLETQLATLRAERDTLATSSLVRRDAVVTLSVRSEAVIGVDLVYLVASATWTPGYNIRATPDGARVAIEYDAVFFQRTGEDWTNVTLTLSTAQPTRSANPPPLEPWYVDAVDPKFGGAEIDPDDRAALDEKIVAGLGLERDDQNAAPTGGGASVTYTLTRPVTVQTDVRRQQRARIALINARPDFTHVAVPVVTDAVYVRGRLVNTSAYQLLPGNASIFVGPDYVGPTRLDAVSPGEPFDVFFGIDRVVSTRRELITKKTAKTGLLGGGRKTSYEFRIEIRNGAGKMISLELWDRIPVSRADRVLIHVIEPSHAMSTDPDYLETDEPRGLLKWNMSVAPGTAVVTYGVSVARPKEVEITALPE